MASVLIIEDDPDIRRLVAETLAARGHHVDTADTAMSGLQLVVENRPELVILDLGLPDLDGAELLRMIRAVSSVPVIAATARGEDSDVIDTLDAGADDYLVKPFSVRQLEARVRAVLRRLESGSPQAALRVGDLTIETGSRHVTMGGLNSTSLPRSSNFSPIWRNGRARLYPAASCWLRCGGSPTAAATARSTSISRGSERSWASPPPSPGTSTPSTRWV